MSGAFTVGLVDVKRSRDFFLEGQKKPRSRQDEKKRERRRIEEEE